MSVTLANSTRLEKDAASSAPASEGTPEADLSIRLFGSPSVRCGGQPLPRMRSRKEQWLLALLVLHAREKPVERLWLAGTLWPESHETQALFYLRRSLSFLRTALGDRAARISSPTPRTLRLALGGAECDVAAFDDALRLGDEASLRRAVDLYRGPLLIDCMESWALPEREKREQGVLLALERLAERAKASGEPMTQAGLLRRVLELDPLRESSLRELMEALAAGGSHAAASETYRVHRARLWRDHNSEPDSETVRLHQRILAEARERADRFTQADRSISPLDFSAASPEAEIQNTSVPSSLSPLIGRQAERASVIAALGSARLVTLTGMGGVGKTRLSLAVAESLSADFADGVWFVDLTPIEVPFVSLDRLAAAALSTLGAREAAGQPIFEALAAHLRSRRLLLVLDNCEHLIAECARLAHSLLRSCPDLRILATSREALHVPSEVVIPVPRLASAEASLLFAERAAQSSFTFRTNASNASAVARICERLDGIPLAIEIAAARTRGMPAARIADNLDGAFRLLNLPGGGSAEPRHQTLRATLDWSYELLSAAEQTLLVRLSIFAGGWTLEAAEAVCGEDDTAGESAVLEALLGLVDKSLVVFTETALGEGRYSLLEMTRHYAGENLRPGDRSALLDKLSEYLANKSAGMRLLQGRRGEHEAVNRFEAELSNVRIALAWCQSAGRVQCGLRLAGCLGKFWQSRGHIAEGRQCVTTALDAVLDTVRDAGLYLEERVIALMCLGILAQDQRDIDEACRRFAEALPLAQALDIDTSAARLFPDPCLTASVLFNLGVALCAKEDRPAARRSLIDALALWTQPDANQGMAKCRRALGQLALLEGDLHEAQAQLEQALEFFESSGNLYFVAQTSLDLAAVIRRQAQQAVAGPCEPSIDEEKTLLRRALTIAQTVDAKLELARAVEALAHLSVLENRYREAAKLRGAAESVREWFADVALSPEEIELRQFDVTACRDALGAADFALLFDAGRAMDGQQAVKFALLV